MAREEVPMSVRRLIVDVDPTTLNVTEFCRMHGISTWFFWDLRRRFETEGEAALEPKSRAAHRIANRTPAVVEDAIVAKRKELVDAGLDAGAATIAFHLRHLDGVPSESTIWRILKARGFIVADPSKAPKRSGRRFNAARANECWQLDDTTWTLANGTEIKILNVIDDHSRLLIASSAMNTCTGAATLAVLAAAATVLGWPARLLSDNAGAFRHVLAEAVAPMGIAHGHSRPYHPQTNGKVERFHQTLKRWLTKQPPAATVEQLQNQLEMFRHLYNHQRPHRSLHRRFPAQIWTDAPKTGPADRPLGTRTKLYRSPVHGGTIRLSNRYRISVGATYNGLHTLTILTGTACHVFADGRLIRALTINPNRTDQRLYNRPGRPTKQP
jgi:transposase InsO family protein